MATDVRGLKRRHLIYYLEVYDNAGGQLLGHLVDITTDGIKLVSKKPIETGTAFSFRMQLPEGYFEEQVLRFDGRSLWCSNDINPDFYDTGFEITRMDEQAMDIIASLIARLGFND